jgi:glycosyltransferase involved in cell wall biosynthesis
LKNIKTQNAFDIVLVTHEPFPLGMAATNRIISYLKPLSSLDILIKVMITKPTEKITFLVNKEAKGIFQGIHFEYVNGTTIWPGKHSKLRKLYLVFSAYLFLIGNLHRDKPKIIITYTSDFFTRIILLLFRPVFQFRLIFEETEYPKILKNSKNRFIQSIHLSLYRRANGMMVMTPELEKYYKGLGAKNILSMPMTVDNSRFNSLNTDHRKEGYFVYVGGSGGFLRDGVLDIIKAFALFSKINHHFRLLIVGPVDESNGITKDIYQFVQEQSLTKKVVFTGAKPTNEIPEILFSATGIVMAPPKNFTSGGFPTKLGEFLASGTPTICTSVSDISTYLDENNSFLVEAGDINGISKAMDTIVLDPKKAIAIGLGGKKLANTAFNAETYISELLIFFGLNGRDGRK